MLLYNMPWTIMHIEYNILSKQTLYYFKQVSSSVLCIFTYIFIYMWRNLLKIMKGLTTAL